MQFLRMHPSAVRLRHRIAAARGVSRICVEQSPADVEPVVHLDVTLLERIAMLVGKAAHRLDIVGHLAQFDAVEAIRRIEGRQPI